MDATYGRRRLSLGRSVLVVLALACAWPQPVEAGGAGRRTVRKLAGAVVRPQRSRPVAARRRFAPRPDVRLAAALRRRALEAEPQVTAALRLTVGGAGGELVDLDHRIKRSASLLGKITRDRRGTDLGLHQAAAAIADVLRYKVVLPFSRYEASRRRIVRDLEARGFAVVKSKDGWGTRYPGHNLQVRSPAGYVFELQFQTRASHEANQRTHEIYRRFRVAEGDEAIELERRILEITGAVPVPRGAGQRAGMTRSNEVMTPR